MKQISRILCAVMVAIMLLCAVGCGTNSSTPADQRQDFHRDMHFTVVYPDGSYGTKFTGTLNAIWTESEWGETLLKLTIDHSCEAYIYKPFDALAMPYNDHDDHYQGTTQIYDSLTYYYISGSFELEKQGNHVIIHWGDARHILVGTVDPAQDPNAVIDQHESCLSSLCKEWWELHTQPKLNINMSLSGVWVTADGEVQSHLERVLFTVSGWLPAEFESYSYVGEIEMDFQWPESFGYSNEGKQTYGVHANMTDRHDFQHALYHISGWWWDLKNSDLTSLRVSICPDSNFVVVRVGDRYLVASTDPNADPAEIFAIYDTYVG